MNKQTTLWTALPNGHGTAGGAHVKISVLVSPRLQSTEAAWLTLGDPAYADFLHWAEKMKTVQFTVEFAGRPPITVAPVITPLDDALWTAIFKPSTPVEPHKLPNVGAIRVNSYPVRNVAQRLKQTYQAVAINSPVLLPRADLADPALEPARGLLRDMVVTPQQRTAIAGELNTRLQGSQARAVRSPVFRANTSLSTTTEMRPLAATEAPVAPGITQAQVDFHQFQDFHASLVGPPRPMPTVAQLIKSIDFHQIVANLQQYPMLMRKLGLILDLQIPFAPELVGAGWVRVTPVGMAAAGKEVVSPRTSILLDDKRFAARPRDPNGDVVDGMLRLNDAERFEIGQVDMDGAGLKLAEVATQMARKPVFLATPTPPRAGAGDASPAPPPREEEEAAPLPSLRSAGLWVARVDRAYELSTALDRVATLNRAVQDNKPEEQLLFAEDLVRGYRVDVWDATADKWFSLCQRVGRYKFAALNQTIAMQDEGWVSSAAVESPTKPNEVYVHETMFRWEGWSLCAPRPGGAVEPHSGAQPVTDQFGVDITFTAKPGSLPRLRFGREYRLRARVVDLAGNSLKLEDATDAAASPPHIYFRSEPVVPPAVIPRTPLDAKTPGESAEIIVIRSRNDTPAKDEAPSNAVSQRHLVPPRTSVQMAELHGQFDGPEAMKGDAATYQMIVAKDVRPEEYYDVDQMPMPYLPDPLAFGVMARLRMLPSSGRPPSATASPPAPPAPAGGGGGPQMAFRAGGFGAGIPRMVAKPNLLFVEPKDQVVQVPFGENWPELRPVRLVLYEPTDPDEKMAFLAPRRALRVPLPKGEAAEIWLSCYLKPTSLDKLQVWRWSVEGVAAPTVRRANLAPPQALEINRRLHQPAALAQWSDQVRLPAPARQAIQGLAEQTEQGRHWMATPFRRLTLVHATQQPLGRPHFRTLNPVKQIGQTFASLQDNVAVSGKTTNKVEVLARWQEWIDPVAKEKPEQIAGQAKVGEIAVERDDASLPLGGMPHEFHDTKYRHINYKLVATSRYAEYFLMRGPGAPPAPDMDFTRTSPDTEGEVDVLSSARPAAPKVLYVIPAFGWTNSTEGQTMISTRAGGWLRVYLERPWYSSGDGELLGVVVSQPSAPGMTIAAPPAAVADRLKPFVTQWGQDPLWVGAAMRAWPEVGDFKGAAGTESGLSLEELPGAAVSVVGYEVSYDQARQLWFADIQVDCGQAYFPFIRLALARYQPKSVKNQNGDCKLSRVVLADLAQVVPDRTVTLSFNAADATRVGVNVSGPTYQRSAASPGPSEMVVTVEERPGPLLDASSWTPVPDLEVNLPRGRGRGGGEAWAGEVVLPAARTARKYRLVVKEYETYEADPQLPPGPVSMVPPVALAKRVVFANVLEI